MIRVGLGYDVHPFGGDGPLVLAGVTIAGEGLVGHSDADAVAHAVADALLGPAGLPDLGALFPASDDQYRGVSSLDLLRDVVARVVSEGWSVGNVDVVINAERPALAPHLDAMRQNPTSAGDSVRLSAYSTTSLSFDAHSSTPMAGFSCGLRTSRSSASR